MVGFCFLFLLKFPFFCKNTPAYNYTKIVTFLSINELDMQKYVSLQAKTLVQNLKRLTFPVPKGDDPLDIY